jgi:hypothetical protein
MKWMVIRSTLQKKLRLLGAQPGSNHQRFQSLSHFANGLPS